MSTTEGQDRGRLEEQPIVQAGASVLRSATEATDRRWWSARRAAEYIGAGPKEIYRAVRGGKLKAVRLNRRGNIRTLREWIDEWMEQKRRYDL